MQIIDNFIREIKRVLPKLTNYFGEDLKNVSTLEITDKHVIITCKEKHYLETGQKVYIKGIELDYPIEEIEGNVITTKYYHNLLSKLTKSVKIHGVVDDTYEYNGDDVPLKQDIDRYNLRLDLDIPEDYIPKDISNAKLYITHDGIINGFHEVEVIDDYSFRLKDYVINRDNETLQLDNNASISIGQRVFGCFDLEDAVNIYSNSYGINFEDEQDTIKKLSIRFKGNNNLTCYVALSPSMEMSHGELTSAGLIEYSLNLYIFMPIAGINKYKSREMIEYITYGVFDRILGDKVLLGNQYLQKKTTGVITYDGCAPAAQRNNTLYIHSMNFSFSVQTKPEDFEVPSDYWRLNELHLKTINNGFNIFY